MRHETATFSLVADATVLEAMKVISASEGICFVIDSSGVLVGSITDGDVRRHLLSGGKTNNPASTIMRKEPIFCHHLAAPSEIQSKLGAVRFLALVDDRRRLVGVASRDLVSKYPLASPSLAGNELAYVTEAVMTGWVSSQGKYVRNFEASFSSFVGATNAVAVSNGTVAIELALAALGIGPGDEVIVPAYTFAATANAVVSRGASPIFVDIEARTLGIDPSLLPGSVTSRTKAIVVPHLYGAPAEIAQITKFAERNNLWVIEDCAEAFGTSVGGKHVGMFGDAGTFSFFGNKTITTGEGGMVVFKDEKHANLAKVLRDHGTSGEIRYSHELLGFNFRMTNMQGALGVAQMERANEIVERKIEIGEQYLSLLKGHPALTLPHVGRGFVNSFWIFTVLVDQNFARQPEFFVHELSLRGIESRPGFRTLPYMPSFAGHPDASRNFVVSERVANSALSLPTSVGMSRHDIEEVAASFVSLLAE